VAPYLNLSENIKINWITLSFAQNLEKIFQDQYFIDSLRQVRIAQLLGVFFYGIFGILDAWLAPEAKYQLWFIRYAIVCPFLIINYVLSFSSHFKKYMQLSIAATVLLAGLGIIAMILIAPFPASYSYYAGLILVFIYGYTFFKLRFIWACLTGWLNYACPVSFQVSLLETLLKEILPKGALHVPKIMPHRPWRAVHCTFKNQLNRALPRIRIQMGFESAQGLFKSGAPKSHPHMLVVRSQRHCWMN